MYCPKCHAVVDEDAKFCSDCGQNLSVPFVEVKPVKRLKRKSPAVAPVPVPMPIAEPIPKKPPTEDERYDLAPHGSNRIAFFPIAEPVLAVAAAFTLPAYRYGRDGFCVVNGSYRYLLLGDGEKAGINVMLATHATDNREAWDYFVAVAALIAVLPERYHPYIDPTGEKLRATVAPMQLPPTIPVPSLPPLPAEKLAEVEAMSESAEIGFHFSQHPRILAGRIGLPAYAYDGDAVVIVDGPYRYHLTPLSGGCFLQAWIAGVTADEAEGKDLHELALRIKQLVPETLLD